MKVKKHSILLVFLQVILINNLHSQDWKELNPAYNQFNAPIFGSIADAAGNVYAAGSFTNAANEKFVTKWDGSQWKELGTGPAALHANNNVLALTGDRAGNIYAAGSFSDNSTGRVYVARWNGTAWSSLGSGATGGNFNGIFYTLTTDPAGNVFAAGSLVDANGKYYVARWNGNAWSILGGATGGLNANGLIYSLAADSAGNIYAAGHFTNINGKYYVAKWDGTAWTEAGSLSANGAIASLSADKTGNLYAGGYFTNAGGYTYVAKLNGGTWSELGPGTQALKGNGPIKSVLCNASGTVVYAGGLVTNNINGSFSVARWTNAAWSAAFELYDYSFSGTGVNTMSFDPLGNLYVGGGIKNDAGNCFIAKWNGTNEMELGKTGSSLVATNGIYNIAADRWGNLYAEGNFINGFGQLFTVAKWDGKGWNLLPGTSTTNYGSSGINGMVTDSAGNLYVGGSVFQNNVEKWDGVNWTRLGGDSSNLHPLSPVRCLKSDLAGNIFAAGLFIENGQLLYGVAKWNGKTWSHFGGTPQSLGLIAVSPAGKVYSIGSDYVQYYISRLDSCCDYIRDLASPNIFALEADASGNVYAGGTNYNSAKGYNYVLKWNGSSFSEMAIPNTGGNSGYVNAITIDPAGTVYAAIHNSNLSGWLQDYVAKWDGATWIKLGLTNAGFYFQNPIETLKFDPRGNLYAAGLFSNKSNSTIVAVYENAFTAPSGPRISGLQPSYCPSVTGKKVILLNPPSPQTGSVAIKIDAIAVTYNADSSFYIGTTGFSAGLHQLKIVYNYGAYTAVLDTSFQLLATSTPQVRIFSNITTVVNLIDPVQLTASNLAGGGLSPGYTFGKDRQFVNILQAESLAAQLSILPASLNLGDNWIYVRMRTSDTCYSMQTGIDSIKINRSPVTGITDIDFPDIIINAYPNPFRQTINFTGLSNAKLYLIKVITAAGQSVFSGKYTGIQGSGIHLPGLTKGVYRVCIYDVKKKSLIGTIPLFKE